MTRRALLSIGLLGAAVLAVYGSGVGSTPIYLCDAEVLFALQAHAIATTLHDVNGRFLPLFFQVYGDMWFQPILVYFMALFLNVLPVSEWTVRFPSVVVGAVNVVLMYLIAKRVFARERWAVLAAILLAVTPSHFIHSRLAMDYLYPVPFLMAWLLCLLIFLERRRTWMLFAAASILGIGFYSYIASAIMMPLYVCFTWLAVWRTRDTPMRLCLVSVAGFIWPLLILIPWILLHADAVAATLGRYELTSLGHLLHSAGAAAAPAGQPAGGHVAAGTAALSGIMQNLRQAAHFSGVTGRISLYWYFFDPSYLFIMGSYANVINSTRRVGVFLLPFLVLVPAGFLQIATVRRTRTNLVLVLGFLSAPLAACLVVPEPYAIDRELEVLPFAVLIATFGVEYFLSAAEKRWRVAGWCLLALVPLHFGFFCFDYFTDYRLRSALWFEGNRRGALEEIIDRDSRQHLPAIYLSTDIPYIDAYWKFYVIKHGRQDLLSRTVYFDSDRLNVQDVPARSLMLTARKDAPAEALVSSGQLRRLMMVPEPGEQPSFAILER